MYSIYFTHWTQGQVGISSSIYVLVTLTVWNLVDIILTHWQRIYKKKFDESFIWWCQNNFEMLNFSLTISKSHVKLSCLTLKNVENQFQTFQLENRLLLPKMILPYYFSLISRKWKKVPSIPFFPIFYFTLKLFSSGLCFFVSATCRSEDFGIVLENLPLSRLF